MTEPVFGIIFNQVDTAALPPVTADFSVIGLVLPSDDANASVFPFNTPVQVSSADSTVLAALGTGPLADAVNQINNQLADLQVGATLVICRVPRAYLQDGVTEDLQGTTANIIGDPDAGTGIYALLKAPSLTGYTPRLIGAPGYTGWTNYGVTDPQIGAQGNNYTHPVITFSPAGATATATTGNLAVTATATSTVNGSGGLTGGNITNQGGPYPSVPAVTVTKVAGDNGAGGGAMHAVLTNGKVTGLVVDTAGVYNSPPLLAIAAPPGGQIASITLTNPGNYAAGTNVTATIADSQSGTGSGATMTATLEQLENPLCAALPQVLNALLAHAPIGGPGTTKAAATAWRGLVASQRLIPMDNWEIIEKGDATAYIDGAASALGLAVRTIFQHGGYPGWCWANQPVQGIIGLKRVDSFSLLDGSTDAEQLLALGIGVDVRGDRSDGALTDSGFVHVSWQNAGSDANYQFYNKTIMRDFENVALIKSIRQRLGKDNITPHDVQSVLDDMMAINVDLQTRECLIGFSIGFSAASNSIADLRAGKFRVFDNTEEPAPILVVTIDRGLEDQALTNELATLAAESSTLTG